MSSHIYLIGGRGSGKTTVGELVAPMLQLPFVDADAVFETLFGMTIAEMFRTDGEAAFRDGESAVLRSLSAGPPAVIATGGGVVVRPENREVLASNGFAIWLKVSPVTAFRRIQADPATAARRPNLTTGGLREVQELLAAREPLYRETAQYTVDADRDPAEVAAAVLTAVRGRGQ